MERRDAASRSGGGVSRYATPAAARAWMRRSRHGCSSAARAERFAAPAHTMVTESYFSTRARMKAVPQRPKATTARCGAVERDDGAQSGRRRLKTGGLQRQAAGASGIPDHRTPAIHADNDVWVYRHRTWRGVIRGVLAYDSSRRAMKYLGEPSHPRGGSGDEELARMKADGGLDRARTGAATSQCR